jgi:hypothetical protein
MNSSESTSESTILLRWSITLLAKVELKAGMEPVCGWGWGANNKKAEESEVKVSVDVRDPVGHT